MKTVLVPLVLGSAFVLLLMLATFLTLPGMSAPSAEQFSLAEAVQRLLDNWQLAGELEDCRQAVERRIEARRQISRDVIARRLSLHEAAVRFGELHEQWPPIPDDTPPAYPGKTKDERLRREVIGWVKAELSERPRPEAQAALSRLEAELQTDLRKTNRTRLPRVLPPGTSS